MTTGVASTTDDKPIKKKKGRPRNEHGGGASGIRGCKCIPCRDKYNEHHRKWNRRKFGSIRPYKH